MQQDYAWDRDTVIYAEVGLGVCQRWFEENMGSRADRRRDLARRFREAERRRR